MCIKVAIVDDDDLIRESLKIIVGSNEDIDVKGTFKNGQELLKYLEGNYLDVVLNANFKWCRDIGRNKKKGFEDKGHCVNNL